MLRTAQKECLVEVFPAMGEQPLPGAQWMSQPDMTVHGWADCDVLLSKKSIIKSEWGCEF